jgi:hypothetical protein
MNYRNLRSILLTFFFAVILVYIFSIFGYVLFQGKIFLNVVFASYLLMNRPLENLYFILFSDDFLMETTPLQSYKRNAPFWTRWFIF